MGKYTDISKCRDKVSKMAQTIIDMESSFDSSMKGFFIDNIVTEYINILSNNIVEKYDYIVENQKEKYDSYGDADESFTKLDVKNFKPKYPDDYNYEVSGALVKDIFQGKSFVVVKIVAKHKEIERFEQTYFHVRKVEKDIKTIDYKKHINYGDFRDNNYVISFSKEILRDKFEMNDSRGGIFYYKGIRDFIWVIDCICKDLKNK